MDEHKFNNDPLSNYNIKNDDISNPVFKKKDNYDEYHFILEKDKNSEELMQD